MRPTQSTSKTAFPRYDTARDCDTRGQEAGRHSERLGRHLLWPTTTSLSHVLHPGPFAQETMQKEVERRRSSRLGVRFSEPFTAISMEAQPSMSHRTSLNAPPSPLPARSMSLASVTDGVSSPWDMGVLYEDEDEDEDEYEAAIDRSPQPQGPRRQKRRKDTGAMSATVTKTAFVMDTELDDVLVV